MNFRRATWGVGLLGFLAILGCGGGDDTPTPGADAGTGAGGSVTPTTDGSGGGSTPSEAGMSCKKTAAMSVTGSDINECKAGLSEAGLDEGGASCFACLCLQCPAEAKTCIGRPFCFAINACCRAQCSACTPPPKEAGPDSSGDAPSSDAPMSTDGAESGSTAADADNEGG
jgi:hypothetical protein